MDWLVPSFLAAMLWGTTLISDAFGTPEGGRLATIIAVLGVTS